MDKFYEIQIGDPLIYVKPIQGQEPQRIRVTVAEIFGDWMTCVIPGEANKRFHRRSGNEFFGRATYGYVEREKK